MTDSPAARLGALTLAVALGATAARADVFVFETPSGNIDCSVGLDVGGSDIWCTIHTVESAPPLPRPANCAAGWGHEYRMRNRGPVEMMCATPQRNMSYSDKATYGVTGNFDGITCTSTQQGFQCVNEDGHGFFLSRARQQVF